MMVHSREAGQFAARLRMLKDRADISYGVLAQRTGISRSSLHRYGAGTKIPASFGVAHAFGRACGATDEELRQLHTLWARADATRKKHPEPDEDTAGHEETAGPDPGVTAAPAPAAGEPRARRTALVVRLAAAALVVTVLAAAVQWLAGGQSAGAGAGTAGGDSRLLFSAACEPVVSMGQHDPCVEEVQTLLRTAGGRLSVDADFGPETLRRVTAFQVLASLPAKGVVDDATKQALYEGGTRLTTWSPQLVERRIREVFPEEPDRAVGIARCQSFLDPLHILPNTNGTRNWGVFQISDARLRDFGGTAKQALGPEWNIQAARTLWNRNHDFSDWPHCDQPFRTTPPPSESTGS